MPSKQTITITAVENGWILHVNGPEPGVQGDAYVARKAAELANLVEEFAVDQAKRMESEFAEVPF